MAEEFNFASGTKEEQYQALLPQLEALVAGEEDLVANMANLSAVLRAQFDFFWVGFYIVKGDELVLGPFQGPLACTRIAKGKGVCGSAWERKETIIVPDVDAFPGHIACSSLSKSEIVVPVTRAGEVVAVLDVDSEYLNHFDEVDARYLAQIVNLLS
ncbi:GAF domain-containing protein [Parapedobacter sp. ISTM3]|uniref:GAF domain-containing protein n=1 Tax=Parapedobacter luteus TaxID=623280 RepID=A0A1T5DPQ9_9SPHI|nr:MULTISPECIES: GAF domain-containing protein [Parapedobacter]MBK1440896.1 GAF domain-containing protein [Parapedobacter sp. ISTM3]SKB73738.1 GAF domain-containing protein [Parapedobacter luteus]